MFIATARRQRAGVERLVATLFPRPPPDVHQGTIAYVGMLGLHEQYSGPVKASTGL